MDEFDPDGHKYPALQFPEHAAVLKPMVAPNVPAGHKVGELDAVGQNLPTGHKKAVVFVEPTGQKYPAEHGIQDDTFSAPTWLTKPVGHGVPELEPDGQ